MASCMYRGLWKESPLMNQRVHYGPRLEAMTRANMNCSSDTQGAVERQIRLGRPARIDQQGHDRKRRTFGNSCGDLGIGTQYLGRSRRREFLAIGVRVLGPE